MLGLKKRTALNSFIKVQVLYARTRKIVLKTGNINLPLEIS